MPLPRPRPATPQKYKSYNSHSYGCKFSVLTLQNANIICWLVEGKIKKWTPKPLAEQNVGEYSKSLK